VAARLEAAPDGDDYYGHFGPIREIVANERVTEIMVNGTDQVYVELDGRLHLTNIRFKDEQQLLELIRYIVQSVGRQIDDDAPLCDARLADGSRVNAVINPISLDGPALTIRKFSRNALQVDDLIRFGSVTPTAFGFLKACVLSKANILISGGTGAGKTTLLNVISGFIPENERIVTIEDAAELQLHQRHVVRLESRPPKLQGRGAVTVRDLVINALRMRPDRLVIGECRGAEALDMLQAMNTGHDGSMTTLHANRARDALARLETMVLMSGIDLPIKAIRQQIGGAINMVIHLARLRDGSRRIVQIAEITGLEEDTITMQEIFKFRSIGSVGDEVVGSLEPTGLRPRILDRLLEGGISLPEELVSLFPAARARIGENTGEWYH
jgi:pilus assembly protein CpaF